jgi:LPS O-antigen subunit length determinant protein (WzzB/FepE family)
MDAESLAQIEQIVTGAVSGGEGRLRQEFGEKTETLAASLRHEIAVRTESLATSLRQEFREGIEEVKRHSGVLYEDVLHRIDLVVEGHQGLNQKIERVETKIERLETKMEHEFLEVRALIQLSYRQLQERVETLEQRVQFIEKRLGLSA